MVYIGHNFRLLCTGIPNKSPGGEVSKPPDLGLLGSGGGAVLLCCCAGPIGLRRSVAESLMTEGPHCVSRHHNAERLDTRGDDAGVFSHAGQLSVGLIAGSPRGRVCGGLSFPHDRVCRFILWDGLSAEVIELGSWAAGCEL